METKNLYFVGRNYVEHAKELNNAVPDKPLIFTKPLSTISEDGNLILPPHSQSVHFEGEMVFKFTYDDFYLVSIGFDFTARDIQGDIKKKGWPWFEAKCFKTATVIASDFVKIKKEDLEFLSVETYLNGELRQKGSYVQTIFKIDYLFDYLDNLVGLEKGDILFTGTPKGVDRVKKGDVLRLCLKLKKEIVSELTSEVV